MGRQAKHVFGRQVDLATQTITIALTQEPPNLDSVRTTDTVSFFVIGHTQEGLVRYDRRGQLAPGVASSWVVSDTSIDFTLREEARWSDGSQVTAEDFVYAWRRLVDPATAAAYASIMFPIKNAELIQRGELPVRALGIEALTPLLTSSFAGASLRLLCQLDGTRGILSDKADIS